jgi:hypothetical protein
LLGAAPAGVAAATPPGPASFAPLAALPALDSPPNVHLPSAAHEQLLPVQEQSPEQVAVVPSVLEPHAKSSPLAEKLAIPIDRTISKKRMLSSPRL